MPEEINGKAYEMVEPSGERFVEILDAMDERFKDQPLNNSRNVRLGVLVLSHCLKADDGSFAAETDILKLPISRLVRLSKEAMRLTGLDGQEQPEKN